MTITKRVQIAKILITVIAIVLFGSTIQSIVSASPVVSTPVAILSEKSIAMQGPTQLPIPAERLFSVGLADVEKTIIGALFCIVAFFIVRLIGKYDKKHDAHTVKLDNLLVKVGELCTEFAHLKGEHDAIAHHVHYRADDQSGG